MVNGGEPEMLAVCSTRFVLASTAETVRSSQLYVGDGVPADGSRFGTAPDRCYGTDLAVLGVDVDEGRS